MKECVVNIAGFFVRMIVADMYYPVITRKVKRYLSSAQNKYDAEIFIYDEGDKLIDERCEEYMMTNDFKDAEVVYSYAKGGMFGWFKHDGNIGHYYISRINGAVRRNPLLPLLCGISVMLPKNGALLFHCAAIVDNQGQTHIFTGKSGSGKTTISKMMRNELNFDVIADDTVVLKTNADGMIEAYTTPFWDVIKPTKYCGVVKTINAIYQNKYTLVKEQGAMALMECLLKNTFYRAPKTVYSQYLDTLFTTAYDLSKRCKYNTIEFEKNLDFWRMMRDDNVL